MWNHVPENYSGAREDLNNMFRLQKIQGQYRFGCFNLHLMDLAIITNGSMESTRFKYITQASVYTYTSFERRPLFN